MTCPDDRSAISGRRSRLRSAFGNMSGVAAVIVDIVGLALCSFLMVSTVVAVAEKWPSFWWLTLVTSLLPVVLLMTVIGSALAAVGNQSGPKLSWINAKRAALLLVFPLIANLIAAVIALGIVLAWFLSG
jgi:hypothetical protein